MTKQFKPGFTINQIANNFINKKHVVRLIIFKIDPRYKPKDSIFKKYLLD